MNLIIEGAVSTKENKQTILNLLKHAATWLKDDGVDHWRVWLNPTEERLNWMEEGLNKGQFYLLYTTEKDLIGMYRLMYEDELYWGKTEDKAAYVHSLVVKNNFKGQGVGTKVLERIEKDLINKNFDFFRLDCNGENTKLCAYYEKAGFKKVGEIKMPHSLNFLYEKKLN
ncbi:protein-tyrosine-phosphatase [Flavobacteriaceae bacterium UJ101]|nr:protein-tyrosine-phosphatase [Flavobacteriaceae bacterium UJ101]